MVGHSQGELLNFYLVDYFAHNNGTKGISFDWKRVRVILLSLGASVLAHPMRPTFAQMESRRKIKQMSKMEPLCIHSHDSRF